MEHFLYLEGLLIFGKKKGGLKPPLYLISDSLQRLFLDQAACIDIAVPIVSSNEVQPCCKRRDV